MEGQPKVKIKLLTRQATVLPNLINEKLLFYSVISILLKLILPVSGSLRTTSEISNNLIGRGIFLFAAIVFNIPGKRVVLQTWNSKVFGLEMCTAGTLSMESIPNLVEMSSLEHCNEI